MMRNTNEFSVSATLLELVKGCEGFRAKAYRCPGGVLTIGYGHTGNDVTADTVITEYEALTMLNRDLQIIGAEVTTMANREKVSLTGNMTDALTSLAFNIGTGALKGSTLWRKITADPNDVTIKSEFNRWVYAGGIKMPGLVKRRQLEYELYSRKD